jgi:hypothetical protein
MPTIGQGGTLTLSAQTDDGAGTPTDVSALTLTVLDPSSSIVSGFPVSLPTIVHDGVGQYHYNWVVGVSATIGDYTAQWQGTLNGAPISGTESIQVVAAGSVVFTPTAVRPGLYVTPTRYRAMGFGTDLTGIDDGVLSRILARASAQVDAYCSIPQLPSKYDFRGGAQATEQHTWTLGDAWQPLGAGGRRVYLRSTPVRTITSFVIKFTNTYQVTIDPANLYLNQSEGWAEVVSLAALVTGVYPVGINFGLYTPVAEVAYTYGYDFPVSGEILLDAGDHKTYSAANQFWAVTPTPVVKKNGAPVTSGITLDFTEGTVTFGSANLTSDIITLDYHYTLPRDIAEATGLLATDALGERDLTARGMTGLARLSVEEITLQRTVPRGIQTITMEVRPEIALLLENWIFRTVR